MDIKSQIGGGIYDEYPGDILRKTKAESVILMVLGGNGGSGFSIATIDPLINKKLPHLLRRLADDIAKQNYEMEKIPQQ